MMLLDEGFCRKLFLIQGDQKSHRHMQEATLVKRDIPNFLNGILGLKTCSQWVL